MFCDKCGSPISSGAQFCSACGKATGAVPIAAAPGAARPSSDRRVQRHIQLLASLWLANGILRFVEVGTILIAGQVLPFLLAWGLFQREPWARVLGLVLGFLALLRPPFGTALGIYTLWVLLPQQSGQEYDQLSTGSVQAGLQHSR